MNVELLRKKLEEYQLTTSPRKLVREFENLGVEFVNLNPRHLEDKYKMRNKIFKEALDQVSEETKVKIAEYTDMIDELEEIIDEAYSLYMPQIRSEITELAELIQSKVNEEGPLNILEIGTKFGGTFLIWNRLNPDGMNISIDMSDGGIHGGVSEEDMDKRDLWFCERFQNCHFIRGDSHQDQTFEQVADLLGCSYWTPKPVFFRDEPMLDFFFIDGDHSYEGVKQDFLNFEPLCKPKSIIAFHDIIISEHHHSRNVFVGEFWDEIKDDNRFDSFEIISNSNQTWAGIGILIKK